MSDEQPSKSPWEDFQPVSRRDSGRAGPMANTLVFAFFLVMGIGAGALFGYLVPVMGGRTSQRRFERQSRTVSEINEGAGLRVAVGASAGGVLTAVALLRVLRNR